MKLRLALLGALGLLGVGGAVYAAGGVPGLVGRGWYDASPLLVSLRPEARAGLTQALGVGRLEDLTLYDLDLAYDAAAATYALGEDVWFTNTTGAPLPDLVLRIYANAAPPESGPQVRFVSGSCVDDAACALSVASPSAIHVQPGAPIAPGGRLHVKLSLTGALTRIDSSRTNFMAQGLEGMKSIFGGGSSGGDYGLLAVGDGIVSFGNFYAVLARREGARWETDEASKLGDLGSDAMAHVRARLELPAQAKLAVAGVVTGEQPLPPRATAAHGARCASPPRPSATSRSSSARGSRWGRATSTGCTCGRTSSRRIARRGREGARRGGARSRGLRAAVRTVPVRRLRRVRGGHRRRRGRGRVQRARHRGEHVLPADDRGGRRGSRHGSDGAAHGAARGMAGAGMTDGMLEFVVAHETAHQWWHGLVGSDSRDHPYVDEALAQYSSIVYLEDRYGPARAAKDGDQNVKMNYQTMRMLGKPDAPADGPVASYGASVQYAGIIYGKAPYLYGAMRKAIGDAAFFSAVRAYVAKYRFREAPARGLVDLLAAAGTDAKVRPLERRWLDEMHGDEDLGTLDMNSMLGGLLGGAAGAAGGLPGANAMPDMQQVLQMFQAAGANLPGGGAGAGGAAPAPRPST